jgi:hypothetical protein
MLVQHFALRADARPLPLDELDVLTVHLLELTPEVRRPSICRLPRGACRVGCCERREARQRVRALPPAMLRRLLHWLVASTRRTSSSSALHLMPGIHSVRPVIVSSSHALLPPPRVT